MGFVAVRGLYGALASLSGVWPLLRPHLPDRLSEIGMLAALAALMMVVDLTNDVLRNGWAGMAVIWPSNGILLGVLLIARPNRMAAIALTGFASILLWNFLSGQPALVMWVAAGIRTVAVTVTALVLRRRLGQSLDLTRPGALVKTAVIAVGLMPLGIAVTIAMADGGLSVANLRPLAKAYFAHGLGVTVCAPLVLALYREELREQFAFAQLGRSLLSFGLLAAVVAAVFTTGSVPLPFLCFPPLLFVVARHGFAGATLAVPLIALIATVATVRDMGPLQHVQIGRFENGTVLQTFVMACAVTAYAFGVIIAERRRQDMELIVRETRARFAEAKLRHSEQLYRHMSENASDIVSRFDLEGRRLYVSNAAQEILGWSQAELVTADWRERVHPDDREAFRIAGEKMLRGEERIVSTYRYARRDGSWAWIEARLRLIRDSQGEPKEYISNARDISLQKETEHALDEAMAELSVLATTDGLTGLANRRRFDETLRREWRRAMRSGEMVALLMVDADHFKAFNDRYGHQEGDACLRLIARTLASQIRRPGDLAARYGGEEFALILPGTSVEGAHELAQRVRMAIQALAHPHADNSAGGGVVTVSIGCHAMVPARDSMTTQLIEGSDAALYAAKRNGRNSVALAPGHETALPAMATRIGHGAETHLKAAS